MTRGSLRIRNLNLGLLLVCALLARALIPTGWMPLFANGTVALQPCNGWIPAPAPSAATKQQHHGAHHAGQGHDVSSSEHQGHGQQHKGGDQPCSFAAASFAWAAFDQPLQIAPIDPDNIPGRIFPAEIGIGNGLAAPPPPATGPPEQS